MLIHRVNGIMLIWQDVHEGADMLDEFLRYIHDTQKVEIKPTKMKEASISVNFLGIQ